MNMMPPVPIISLEISPGEPFGDTLLALNNSHAEELSWLEPEQMKDLVAQAFYARKIGDLDAFLIALDQNGQYDNPNFRWFRSRYNRFVYVDRIVVAPSARGKGCARQLYADLFDRAAEAGYDRIVCEVNRQPPNPSSDAFHAALGFIEVGSASIHDGRKTVRYLSRAVIGASGGSASDGV